MPNTGLIIGTSGTPDDSGVYLDGRLMYGITSTTVHLRSEGPPRTMLKFTSSPFFSDEVLSREQIVAAYSVVVDVGTNCSPKVFYKGVQQGFIEEMCVWISKHNGVSVEIKAHDTILDILKEKSKDEAWIVFVESTSEVEFTVP